VDLKAQARALVSSLDGAMNASPYDTAWLARLPSDHGSEARWPDLLDWLFEHQWSDGSWGSAIPYFHDRILCTLMAIIALREQAQGKRAAESVRRGERYIWRNFHYLHHDPVELVGFELIFPTLLAEARNLGLDVPSHSCGYGRIRGAKLRLLPTEALYTPGTSVAFSLEFLGRNGDPERLGRLVAANGSVANSPATTAYLALQQGVQNGSALGYLEQMKAQPAGVPHFYPLRIFEIAWVLEHLTFGGLSLNNGDLASAALLRELESVVGERGVSMDPDFGIDDGDTTAVTARMLALAGRPVDPQILQSFEDPGTRTFRTFSFERNASVSTNAHSLEALALMPDYPDRQEVWDRVVTMLLASRKYQSYWTDKWHASPFYATSHVLIGLLESNEPLISECLGSIDWLIHMQRSDGSWGYFDRGTAEETAYVLLTLLRFHLRFNTVDAAVLHRGAAYLWRAFEFDQTYPDLWIAKSLFAPEGVVGSAILAAMHLYQESFGHAPG
jgi:halimadienyl-diphosphate synthase